MRNRIILAVALAALALPVRAQELKVEEHVLPNGMRLLLVPRADEPSIAAGWVAHVGSANERPGITGISHLFEHMMFKGTKTIGSKDPARDQKLIEEQERVRGLMRDEDAKLRAALRLGEIDDITKPENKTARYKELDKEFDALVKEQRDLLVKNEFDRIYTKNGGSGMNASTNTDLTQYFVTVPKNKLELWFWMESDRLARARLPRVLLRARRRLRGTAPEDRVDADRPPRRGVRGDVLARPPVLVARRRVRLGHPGDHEGPGRRVLRALLRAEQPHGDPRRRLRPEGGARARRRRTSAASRAERTRRPR